jgi:hypothetical protein
MQLLPGRAQQQIHCGGPEPKILSWRETTRLIANTVSWMFRRRNVFALFSKVANFSQRMNKIGKHY